MDKNKGLVLNNAAFPVVPKAIKGYGYGRLVVTPRRYQKALNQALGLNPPNFIINHAPELQCHKPYTKKRSTFDSMTQSVCIQACDFFNQPFSLEQVSVATVQHFQLLGSLVGMWKRIGCEHLRVNSSTPALLSSHDKLVYKPLVLSQLHLKGNIAGCILMNGKAMIFFLVGNN